MKVLVTGGLGYIGSVLCEYLLKKEFEVFCLDNFFYQQMPNSTLFHDKRFTFIKEDVLNVENVEAVAKDCEIIIPLAALVGAPICDKFPELARQTNYDAVKDLVSRLRMEQKVIMPITNSGYGIGADQAVCTEESSLRPISNYGRDKVELEQFMLENFENFVSFRLATVFGSSPRMRKDLLVNDFVYRAFKDRFLVLFEHNFVRNFIHVRDVSRAFIYCLENWRDFKGEVFNLGLSNANLTKLELAKKIKAQIVDLTILLEEMKRDPDQRNYIVSNDKIEKRGFETRYTVDDGISELIKFYSALPRENFSNV